MLRLDFIFLKRIIKEFEYVDMMDKLLLMRLVLQKTTRLGDSWDFYGNWFRISFFPCD
jgi:hypothetical protein